MAAVVTAPMPFFFKKIFWRRVGPPLRPPQRVAAVGQGSYSVNLSAPTQRCHVKIAGGKFDRRSAMGAVRTAPTLGKYPPQICPFFVVYTSKLGMRIRSQFFRGIGQISKTKNMKEKKTQYKR